MLGRTAADEVLVATSTHDRAKLLESYRFLAEVAAFRAPARH
jgi:hypothetical protein